MEQTKRFKVKLITLGIFRSKTADLGKYGMLDQAMFYLVQELLPLK